MKVWILELGWAGGYVVVARNREEAVEKIMEKENFIMNYPEEYKASDVKEIPEDGIYRFLGDL